MVQVDARNVSNAGATMGEIYDLRQRSQTLERISAINAVDANLDSGGDMEHVSAASVSDDFLPLLGARPALGRTLDSRVDDGKDQVLAILISDELWRRRFSADPAVIGRGVRVNNLQVQIVGVLPPKFRLYLPPSVSDLEQIDVWFPYTIDGTREYRGIPLAARLKPGANLDQANAELQVLAEQFQKEHPDYYSGAGGWQASPSDSKAGGKLHLTARPLQQEMTRDVRSALLLLSGAVGFVLLTACVNVANLTLARGSARQRELEIRRALGAGRAQIIRQILMESFLLSLAAAVFGLAAAHFGLQLIARLDASHIPLQSRIGIDIPVAIFAVLLAAVTSALCGLLPAWRLASGEMTHVLHAGRSQTAGFGARKLQRTLVAAEVALSIVPLACGGLMLRSFLNLMHSPLGFNPANVVTAKVPINYAAYATLQPRWGVFRDAMERVKALPGIQAVSGAAPLPLEPQETRRLGRIDRPDSPPILATQQSAFPGYLSVIGTPLLAGRDFTDDDIVRERRVTIIDETLAKRLWPEGAIGKILSIYRTGKRDDLEIVGVTAPVRVTRVRDENIPHFMIPYDDYGEVSLVIKTPESAEQLSSGIQSAVQAAHGGRAAFDIVPMSDYVSASIGDTRFILFVLAAFAGASVMLAGVGLYGTLAYLTSQRTREFGIRLALGSSSEAIFAGVLRESIWLAIGGTAAGLLGVAATAGAIRSLLYGVQPLDGVTLAGVAALVCVVALLAASVPAWRASQIDPQTLLRSE
jgi:putative ABC transport system permease protein